MNPIADHSIEHQLKILWGATAMPFGKTVRTPFLWPGFEQALRRLRQGIGLRSSGVLTGANGAGKSFLLAHCLRQLPEKEYAILNLHHTSMTGSDLLRSLCYLFGHKPRFRRSDTIELIGQSWCNFDGRFPLLVIDEAQNLSGPALEELRLLGCGQFDARPLFGLILAGDENLLPRLQLGINRPLLTRLGFFLELTSIDSTQAVAYIQSRLREVSMPEDTFDAPACQLLCQASEGALRTLGLIARQAIQNATEENRTKIAADHIQHAIEQLPWFAPALSRR